MTEVALSILFLLVAFKASKQASIEMISLGMNVSLPQSGENSFDHLVYQNIGTVAMRKMGK